MNKTKAALDVLQVRSREPTPWRRHQGKGNRRPLIDSDSAVMQLTQSFVKQLGVLALKRSGKGKAGCQCAPNVSVENMQYLLEKVGFVVSGQCQFTTNASERFFAQQVWR